MNFLIAAPTRIGTAKVGLQLGMALSELGHAVSFFDYDDKTLWQKFTPKVFRSKSWESGCSDYVNQKLLNIASRQAFDVFLCVKGLPIQSSTIRKISGKGIRAVGYWIDDPNDFQRSLLNAAVYDLYMTNDAHSLPAYRKAGINNVEHLPMAADTAMFFPIPESKKLADIIFIGTRTDYRENILNQLEDFDLRVYGPGWRNSSLRKHQVFPEAFGAKTNMLYNSARINLNIHNWIGKGSQMNLRLFEVPATMNFLLTDWVAEIDDAYVDGEHLICWRSVDELKQKIPYYLNNQVLRDKISRQGYDHFVKRHTYKNRAVQLLEYINRLPDAGA